MADPHARSTTSSARLDEHDPVRRLEPAITLVDARRPASHRRSSASTSSTPTPPLATSSCSCDPPSKPGIARRACAEAIQGRRAKRAAALDCFAPLAMTGPMTRRGYDGVVLAAPTTIAYARSSIHPAQRWIGQALAAVLKRAGLALAPADLDGFCVLQLLPRPRHRRRPHPALRHLPPLARSHPNGRRESAIVALAPRRACRAGGRRRRRRLRRRRHQRPRQLPAASSTGFSRFSDRRRLSLWRRRPQHELRAAHRRLHAQRMAPPARTSAASASPSAPTRCTPPTP